MEMKRIQFSLVNGNDRYITINIPYDEKVWDEIIDRYVPREKYTPADMADSPTVAGMFGVNAGHRDGLD